MKETKIVNQFIWDGNKMVTPAWFPKRTYHEYIKFAKGESGDTEYKQLILITQRYHNFILDGQKKREKVKYILNPNEKFVEDSDGNFYII